MNRSLGAADALSNAGLTVRDSRRDGTNKSMRTITDHIVNPANDKLIITVEDEPGAGGANHLYRVKGYDKATNMSCTSAPPDRPEDETEILFQNGAIPVSGVNGLTQEVLLAIVIDRLRSFQAGPFACRENAIALTHIETGLMWLNQRTRNRQQRGVEGTHTV